LEAFLGGGADDEQEVGVYRLGTRNEIEDRLIDFCRQYDMVIFVSAQTNSKI